MSCLSQHISVDELPNVVLCFDRDYTINVNPHPDKPAVPLSWVKHLAHERDNIDVWATGNQFLTEEARIPGLSQAVTCWRAVTLPDDIERYHEHVSPQSGRLSRREGLELIQAIYEEVATSCDQSFRFVVVDDVDVSDLDGWNHFFPWSFVRGVKNGCTSIDVPVPLDTLSDIPLTDSDCPESYPPIDHDEPIVLKRLGTTETETP